MRSYQSGRLFAILALALLFLAACGPAAPATTSSPIEPAETAAQPLEAETEEPAPIPTVEGAGLPEAGMQVPEGWQVITDSSGGYSLAHSPAWVACQETKYTRAYCETEVDPAWGTIPLRLYVSAFPQDYTNSDFDVYNFIPTDSLREFMALPVGESKLKEPNAVEPEFFTFTRLPDRMVAGGSAPVIENSKLWEFPAETKERVAFILTESTTYMLGTYYETPEQLAMFEQVLDSFQLTP